MSIAMTRTVPFPVTAESAADRIPAGELVARPVALRRAVVIGCGVIGTSVALALRRARVEVALVDRDASAAAEAVRMGAGRALDGVRDGADPMTGRAADIVIIATPPSSVAEVLRDAQARGLGAVYTDVASTKARIVADAERAGCDIGSYVPGHPMAGRELSGPAAARRDLFAGRPWAVCPAPATRPEALRAVAELIALCGAIPAVVAPEVHDRVVAAVSHVPHLVSAALAARFAGADETTLSLAGRGLLDVTRIAGGAPGLWRDILEHNAGPIAVVLESVVTDLAAAAAALRASGHSATDTLVDLLTRGNRGHAQITARAGAA
jgi:prephenate dehydrogenase